MPKVSIIIPAHNAEDYIGACLTSIIEQTESSLEIIVIDDGSLDHTVEIVKGYQVNDSRIVLLQQKGEGHPKARNKGLVKSTGDYIMFVDADDTVESTFVQTMYDTITQQKVDVVVCAYNNINVYKHHTYLRTVGKEVNNLSTSDFCVMLNSVQLFNPVWNKIYKRSLFSDTLFKDIVPGQDALLNLELFAKGIKYRYIDIPLYNYYSRGTVSVISSYKPRLLESRMTLYSGWNHLFEFNTSKVVDGNTFLANFRAYIDRDIIANIYKNNSPYNFSQRTRYISRHYRQMSKSNGSGWQRLKYAIPSHYLGALLVNICCSIISAERKLRKYL